LQEPQVTINPENKI